MANRLTMAEIDRILTLHTTEHSNREIADLLGISRETVDHQPARKLANRGQPLAETKPSPRDGLAYLVAQLPANGQPARCVDGELHDGLATVLVEMVQQAREMGQEKFSE